MDYLKINLSKIVTAVLVFMLTGAIGAMSTFIWDMHLSIRHMEIQVASIDATQTGMCKQIDRIESKLDKLNE